MPPFCIGQCIVRHPADDAASVGGDRAADRVVGADDDRRRFDPEEGEWKSARGKAYLKGGPGEGRLKVTFFWPFYGGYNIIGVPELID